MLTNVSDVSSESHALRLKIATMSPTMFRILELLRYTLESLSAEEGNWDKQTLYAAAQVNTLWSSIALDCLWEDLTLENWYYFIGVTLNNQHELSSEQYNEEVKARALRFIDVYAPRVRFLTLDFFVNRNLGRHLDDVWGSLPPFNMSRLMKLDVRLHPTSPRTSLLRKFVTTNIRDIRCTLCKSPTLAPIDRPRPMDMIQALQVLQKAGSGDLSSFDLSITEYRDLTPELINAVLDMPLLDTVSISPQILSPQLVVKLADHPTLRTVSPALSSNARQSKFSPVWSESLAQVLLTLPRSPANAASTLTSVSVCTSIRVATSLLADGFNPDILVSINVLLTNMANAEEILSFAEKISKRYRHLKQLRLAAPEYYYDDGIDRSERILWSSLRPFCDCSAMEDFEIFWHTLILISNEEVEELAASWPRLGRLVLQGVDPISEEEEATLTMDSLRALANYCPTLQHLYLHLSPTISSDSAPNDGDEPSDAINFSEMREVALHLGLPLPRPDEAQIVANIVRQAFPTRCKITCPYLVDSSRTNLGPDGMENGPDTNDILTPWKMRQSSILEAWTSIMAAMSSERPSIELGSDYVPRRF